MSDTHTVIIRQGTPAAVVLREREKPVVIFRGANLLGGSASGGGSGDNIFTHEAGENLGGHRAVYIAGDGKAYLADHSTAHELQPVGVTVGSASVGFIAQIQSEGELQEPSWAWSNGPVYLGVNGLLTQVAPLTGSIFVIGVAAGPTRIRVSPQLIAKL
jgi:hypothetical protein